MSHPIHTAIEAEVAYRREQLLRQFHPVRRPVGAVRESRRTGRGQSGAERPATQGNRPDHATR